MAVQSVSARRVCGRKFQKSVEERFMLIHDCRGKGFSSNVERGGPQLTRDLWNEEESSVGNCVRAPGNVAEELRHNSPKQGFFCGGGLPIGSTRGNGDVKGTLQSPVGIKHSQDNELPKSNNGRKLGSREFKTHIVQGGGAGSNILMQSSRTTSEAIAILKNRQQQGVTIDSKTFVELLKQCLKQKDLTAARQAHDCITKSGMDKNPYVATTLLNVYIRCGRLHDARQVFNRLEKKSLLTWNIMLGGYAKAGRAEEALEVFNQMRQCQGGGAQPDEITYLSILKACASASNPLALEWGKEVHTYIRQAGLESNVRVGTALLQMYAKCGCIEKARQAFEKLGTNRNVVTWNVMIGAYAESGCRAEAYELFLQMEREGFKPDAITFTSLLNARASSSEEAEVFGLEWVKEIHSHFLGAGLEFDLWFGNALVHMYAKSGSIDDARLVFDGMKERDVITWNAMIGAYAESGCGVEEFCQPVVMQDFLMKAANSFGLWPRTMALYLLCSIIPAWWICLDGEVTWRKQSKS